jgi:CRISPR/Cas system-associated exonuclease Cas4 (RecB family)
MEMLKVSQSKLKVWRKCRQAYGYKYIDGLRRKKPSRPLKFGTIAHYILETAANGDDWEEALDKLAIKEQRALAEARDEYGDIIEDVRTIMTEYFRYYKKDTVSYIPYNKQRAEHLFEIPITKSILFKGKIDGFAKTGNGLRWLVEHKTFSRMPSEDHRWRNIQSAVYLWVADKLKVKLDGVMWDYIGSKPPSVPTVLKDGSTSTRQIDSFPSVIRKTLKERGELNDEKYKSMLEQDSSRNWFQRIYTRKRPQVIEAIVDDFIETAKEIEEIGQTSRVRTIDQHCDYCEYEPLCRAVMQGHDVKFTEKMEYYHEENEFDYHEVKSEE